MDLLNSRIKRNDSVAWRVIEGEALVVDPESSNIYPLNTVATRVWELLGGEKSCKEIIEIIFEEFEVDGHRLRKDVLDFVGALLNKGLAAVL